MSSHEMSVIRFMTSVNRTSEDNPNHILLPLSLIECQLDAKTRDMSSFPPHPPLWVVSRIANVISTI